MKRYLFAPILAVLLSAAAWGDEPKFKIVAVNAVWAMLAVLDTRPGWHETVAAVSRELAEYRPDDKVAISARFLEQITKELNKGK